MTAPYYQDDLVTLYHGDCREVTDWLKADVLVTDPPYGIGWARGGGRYHRPGDRRGIVNDQDPSTRDAALEMWGTGPGYVFGSPLIAPPTGAVMAVVWQKASQLGMFGSFGGWRRDWEMVYLLGGWTVQPAARSGVIRSFKASALEYDGHPHAKPVGLMAALIEAAPPGVIADPFAGSGSTLVAAKLLGRRAVGVEVEERYCETAANRLAQGVLAL